MSGLGAFIPIILMIVLFYFLLIRPQQKRQKEVQSMQNSLAKGDKIVTIGGLHGIVDVIEEGIVVIKCGGSKLTFDRNAIRSVLEKGHTQSAALDTITEQSTEDAHIIEDESKDK